MEQFKTAGFPAQIKHLKDFEDDYGVKYGLKEGEEEEDDVDDEDSEDDGSDGSGTDSDDSEA